MIGENRLSHSYRKIGRTLVRIMSQDDWQFVHVPVTDDDGDFYHWIGYLVVGEGSE